MAQLRQDYARLQALDVEVLVIGPESAEDFRAYWTQEALPFVGLPDPAHKVLKLYGQQVNLFKLGRMPAQMLIDKQGVLRYVHYGHAMSDIPSTDQVIAELVG